MRVAQFLERRKVWSEIRQADESALVGNVPDKRVDHAKREAMVSRGQTTIFIRITFGRKR